MVVAKSSGLRIPGDTTTVLSTKLLLNKANTYIMPELKPGIPGHTTI